MDDSALIAQLKTASEKIEKGLPAKERSELLLALRDVLNGALNGLTSPAATVLRQTNRAHGLAIYIFIRFLFCLFKPQISI